MNSLSMGKYRPAVILTLALTVFLASCKGTSDDPVTTPTPPVKGGVITTLAGTGRAGSANTAPNVAAQFSFPAGVAVDSDNNVYVADSGNNCIRKIEWVWRAGWLVTTVAGTGTATASGENPDNAVATAATFNQPASVAVDSSGNLYVADTGNNLIRKITISNGVVGEVSTIAGDGTEGYHDATGTEAQFRSPKGVAVAGTNLYVVDTGNNCIRKITSTGIVTTFAGRTGMSGLGSADGAGLTEAQFGFPTGVAVDSSGNLYVADYFNNLIRKITSAGEVDTLAGTVTDGRGVSGTDDGIGTAAKFNSPAGVAVDSSGNVYVVDTYNDLIRKIVVANDGTATVTTLAGDGTTGHHDATTGTAATFNSPNGVAVDSSGNLYVADTENHTIRKIEL